jgi:type II secretory pathway predicted ATPase ExeA
MYKKHFGLTRDPFAKNLQPDELYVSGAEQELETRLNYLINLCGIGLVTGEAGAGKTTVTRKVTSLLHTGRYRVFYVALSTGNVMDTYKSIAWEMGLPTERSRAALYRVIRTEVSRLCLEARIQPILVVDDAHHLRSDILEDLRLMTNYQMDSENRLCLLLIGQAELRRRLQLAVHEALNQRIIIRHHLGGLDRGELAQYLDHLLHLAGTEMSLFEPDALEAIFQATGGLPRKVNLLSHHALTAAAVARAKTVTASHVETAVAEVS